MTITIEHYETTRAKFLAAYDSDPEFHKAVDRLLYDEVVRLRDEVGDLRAALGRIASTRREEFRTGFEYEVAIRKSADAALGRTQ
jgi:hypothetical protein